jgi:hypothetical protein
MLLTALPEFAAAHVGAVGPSTEGRREPGRHLAARRAAALSETKLSLT